MQTRLHASSGDSCMASYNFGIDLVHKKANLHIWRHVQPCIGNKKRDYALVYLSPYLDLKQMQVPMILFGYVEEAHISPIQAWLLKII